MNKKKLLLVSNEYVRYPVTLNAVKSLPHAEVVLYCEGFFVATLLRMTEMKLQTHHYPSAILIHALDSCYKLLIIFNSIGQPTSTTAITW